MNVMEYPKIAVPITPSTEQDVLHFSVLGIVVQVRFDCLRTQKKVVDHFFAHQVPLYEQSPDLCVHLTEPLDADRFRYLFRQQPASNFQSLGAYVLKRGQTNWEPWLHHAPVLIPYTLPELQNRFAALHAAAIVNPKTGKATIITGKKLAGKTSVSLTLAREKGWLFLTDETTIIDTWSQQVWPLVRPPHVTESLKDKTDKRFMESTEFYQNLKIGDISPADRIVELVHVPGVQKPVFQAIDHMITGTSILFQHSLEFGSERRTTARCLSAICQKAEHVRILHGGYHHLSEVTAFLERTDAE